MSNNFVVIIPSKSKSQIRQSVVDSHQKICSPTCKIVCEENTRGLSTFYNTKILESTEFPEYYVFIHDDVEIQDSFFIEKLIEGFKTYDIIGVAGSRKVSLKNKNIAWHLCERQYWRGAVTHPVKEDKTKLYVNSFGYSPDEVATVDGLFIAVHRRVFDDGVRFNQNYDFDFYDMAFCMNARLKGFKIGVVPIHLVHYSHGDGITRLTYTETQEKFREEYRKLL